MFVKVDGGVVRCGGSSIVIIITMAATNITIVCAGIRLLKVKSTIKVARVRPYQSRERIQGSALLLRSTGSSLVGGFRCLFLLRFVYIVNCRGTSLVALHKVGNLLLRYFAKQPR